MCAISRTFIMNITLADTWHMFNGDKYGLDPVGAFTALSCVQTCLSLPLSPSLSLSHCVCACASVCLPRLFPMMDTMDFGLRGVNDSPKATGALM